MANWQARDKKVSKRRDVKDQKKFYNAPRMDKNKTHKLVMKERAKQRENGHEDEGEDRSP